VRFETAEGAWLISQGGAVQPAAVQMLADSPLGQMNAMPRFQDRADLDCGATWQFQSKLAGFLQQFGMAAYNAQVGQWRRPQTVQPAVAVGPQPAVERAAGVRPATAISMFVGLVASSRTSWPRSAGVSRGLVASATMR
jgi:hypothetical protein